MIIIKVLKFILLTIKVLLSAFVALFLFINIILILGELGVRSSIKEGNQIIAQVEAFKQQNGALPEEQPFYEYLESKGKENEFHYLQPEQNYYILYFCISIDDCYQYDSESKSWNLLSRTAYINNMYYDKPARVEIKNAFHMLVMVVVLLTFCHINIRTFKIKKQISLLLLVILSSFLYIQVSNTLYDFWTITSSSSMPPPFPSNLVYSYLSFLVVTILLSISYKKIKNSQWRKLTFLFLFIVHIALVLASLWSAPEVTTVFLLSSISLFAYLFFVFHCDHRKRELSMNHH